MKSNLPVQFLRLMVMTFCLFTMLESVSAQEAKEKDGAQWESMFDGKSLEGWKVSENKESVFVEDGKLVVYGKRAHAFYVGADGKADFVNFHFKAKVMTTPGANSGIYFHTKYQEEGWPQTGYEAQVNNTQKDKKKTGGLYNVQDNFEPPVKDNEWFDYDVIVRGKRIVLKINGKTISDYTEPADLDRPNRCLNHGTIALQAHDPNSKVYYKDLKVKRLPSKTTHSFLGVGKANRVVIVDEAGKVSWKYDVPASDGWVLESGNVLLAVYPTKKYPRGAVIEVDPKNDEVIWQYQGQQKEISTVQQIGDNEYLVAELGKSPSAIVIDRDGKVLREMALKCQKKNAHMQTRMLRALPNGNWIAPHLLDFAVKEYKPESGEVVSELKTDDRGRAKRDWPFTAIRLKNGNTLIGCTNGNRVIELNRDNEIVWSLTNDDLSQPMLSDACGVQRLPNGNTVVTSYHAKGDQVKLLEVNPQKEVVWTFSGMKAGFHHFQILTTNGQPVDGKMR